MAQTKKQKEKQEFIIPTSELDLTLIKSIEDTSDYYKLTNYIESKIENIFDNYLKIGKNLKTINDQKLYDLEDYDSIYEYASDKFDLSKTTVHNIIAISTRFTDEYGALLEEYKGLTFSTLVELVSVDELDLDNYKGLTTVREVRNKKREIKLVKLIDESLNESGSVTQIIEAVKQFDIHTELNNLNLRLTYEINKKDFDPDENRYGYGFSINFQINNLTIDSKNIKFEIIINSRGYRFSSYFPWVSKTIEKISDIDVIMKEYCSDVLKEIERSNRLNQNKSENGLIDTSPSFYRFSQVNDSNLINPIFNQIIKELNGDVYYEFVNNNNISIYRHPKKNKKTNPALFHIKYPNDLMKIQILDINNEAPGSYKSIIAQRNELVSELRESILNMVLETTELKVKTEGTVEDA